MPRAPASLPALLDAHAIGRKLLKELPARGKYGDNSLRKLAQQFGLTKHQAWVFRRFAASDVGYSQKEVKELVALCRKHDNHGLTTSFIELLIRVPRHQRRRFERQLVQDQWSFQEAKRQVQRLVGKRQGGGRRHQLPADRASRLRKTEEVCASFQRLVVDLLAGRQETALPPGVRQRLRQATVEVGRLREAAATARRRLATV